MNYSGTTLNERLYQSGDLKRFNKALRKKDREELTEILKSVEIENPDIDFLIENTKIDDSWLVRMWNKITGRQ